MPVTINRNTEKSAPVPPKPTKKSNGHTRPQVPLVSLSEPGRLRVSHVMALLGVSHSTLYSGVKIGRYPKNDGKDGKFPYWKTSTIKSFLDA